MCLQYVRQLQQLTISKRERISFTCRHTVCATCIRVVLHNHT
ncbi:hypothetical protein LAZ93_00915 [Paenibacillus polymyxa]|nr:hypothetical protein LAZ93_00915 [Paenibacillus polymyxa]